MKYILVLSTMLIMAPMLAKAQQATNTSAASAANTLNGQVNNNPAAQVGASATNNSNAAADTSQNPGVTNNNPTYFPQNPIQDNGSSN